MFSKTVALLSLAAIVSGRVMIAVEMPNIPTPAIVPTPTASIPASAPPSTPTPGIPPSSGVMDGPCTEEGIWNCIDGSSFQRCASGVWSVVMPVAPGTHCARGIREDLKIMHGKFPGGTHVGTPTVPTPGIPTPGPVDGTPSEPRTGRCKIEGVWNCIDGASYQRCASGEWSVVQDVAPGTKCTIGMNDSYKMQLKRPLVHRKRRVMV